jgi:hypothetical protein
MKSREDFSSLNAYREYLRDYYAGQMAQAIITAQYRYPEAPSRDQLTHDSKAYAEALVKELYGDYSSN